MRCQSGSKETLAERHRRLPVWIRATKNGPEYYTGVSRAKLYELAGRGLIQSFSLREEMAERAVEAEMDGSAHPALKSRFASQSSRWTERPQVRSSGSRFCPVEAPWWPPASMR